MESTAEAIVAPRAEGAAVITETTITDDSEDPPADGQGFHLLVMSLEVFWSQPLPGSGIVTVGRSSRSMVQLEDPMASREHARIHVGSDGGVPVLTIEDVGSANGTRVREVEIKPGEPAAVLPGESILIGSTVLMVLQDRPTAGHRRIWSHAYFEARVEEECGRAARHRAVFALARLRFSGPAPWTRVTPVLAAEPTATHLFASYGPKDYEILFTDARPGEPEAALQKLVEAFRTVGLEAKGAVAWYPNDGRTGDALLAFANSGLRSAAGRKSTTGEHVGPDVGGMRRVQAMATRAAPSNINVLIVGESGVGKDVLARLIHQLSPRAGKPFVAINCASLTETLMESELFGHEKSAFTGAMAAKVGLFESASGGTVFLDEIGEMSPSMQARLLQAIELREVRPVGAVRSRPIDVRFISATNVDIEAAVARGAFRGDLMYRLNTLTLAVPPLRERRDEIEALVRTFVAQACRDMGRETIGVSAEVMESLQGYRWPGNIRELKNAIDRAVALCDGTVILPEHIDLAQKRSAADPYLALGGQEAARPAGPRPRMQLPPLDDPAEEAEREKILDALDACAWSQTRAAEMLGISRRTLVTKLERYGIPRPQRGREDDGERTVAKRSGASMSGRPRQPADGHEHTPTAPQMAQVAETAAAAPADGPLTPAPELQRRGPSSPSAGT
jgi:DNA-binding NtrC family response regulator